MARGVSVNCLVSSSLFSPVTNQQKKNLLQQKEISFWHQISVEKTKKKHSIYFYVGFLIVIFLKYFYFAKSTKNYRKYFCSTALDAVLVVKDVYSHHKTNTDKIKNTRTYTCVCVGIYSHWLNEIGDHLCSWAQTNFYLILL